MIFTILGLLVWRLSNPGFWVDPGVSSQAASHTSSPEPHEPGVGKLRLVRLVRLGASASSNVCKSYQIKSLTLFHTLSLLLTLLTSLFSYSKPNNTCSKRNRHGSGVSVVLRTIALLTLTLTGPNLNPDADLERNLISDPVFNVYPDLNCTRRT